jgi:hypothetical protein
MPPGQLLKFNIPKGNRIMKYRSIVLVMVVLTILLNFTGIVHAQQPAPTSTPGAENGAFSSAPPVIPTNSTLTAGSSPQLSAATTLSLPALKAVVIVGPIDGSNGSWTNQEKANADLAANELSANGVTVYKFYTPNAKWDDIKAAANGAQFLIYRGHGIAWNTSPTPPVGGFDIDGPNGGNLLYSSADIQANLKLAPNAIVMIYACFAAGGSSTDTAVISSAEAIRRVGEYSAPFLALGASAYYSDWYGDSFQAYIRSLFQGATLVNAYKAFGDYDPNQVISTTHPANASIPLYISYDTWANYTPPSPQYDDVFAGQPNKTLQDLFAPPTLLLSSQNVTYLAQPDYGARDFTVNVTSNTSSSFNWSTSVSPSGASTPNWLTFNTSGAKGSPITFTIQPQSGVGTYKADIQVSSSDSSLQPQIVHVSLVVVNKVIPVFLPTIKR